LRNFDINSVYICPPHLYIVATLPWEIQNRSYFQTVLFIRSSDYLRYLRRKQTVTLLSTTPENVTALPCKIHNIFIWMKVCAFLQTLVALTKASCGLSLVALKRTGC